MGDRYLDDYLPVIAIDVAVEEKTKIAKMAAATLHKLHNVMQQMKEWRDDSAKLKSNIWRMKMALRADDKNGSDYQQIDPLVVHQRAEINRLGKANDALQNEVASLKRTVAKAEEDIARIAVQGIGDTIARIEDEFSDEKEHLNDEIAKGDRMIEMIFANAISRVVETIVNLSEELVNISETLYRLKTKNRNLHLKVDRLRAMLRSRSGSNAAYRRRINELNGLAEQLMGESSRLKVIRENANHCESLDFTNIPNGVVRHAERLMNDLKNNLKNDRETMIAAGDPDCFKYMKKIVDLRVSLKALSVELGRSNASVRKWSRESERYEKFLKAALLLNHLLREIDIEISNMKAKPMGKYCRIGGVSGTRYMTKVIELENVVKKSTAVITILKRSPLEVANSAEKTVEELENLIEQLCSKIRDLEVFDDRSSLRERIDRLEISVIHLRLELMEKNDCINALTNEYSSIRLTLKSDRDKDEATVAGTCRENESLRKGMRTREQEVLRLSHKREHSERRVAEMQLMKVEIDAVRKKLQHLPDDKETLLGETGKMRNILRERDKEIEDIITGRDTAEGVLRAEIKDLKMELSIASDENVKLKSIIEGLGKQGERERPVKLKSSGRRSGTEGQDNGERSQDRARNLRDELERLKAESNESKVSLDEANKRVDYLKRALDKAVDDRARLQHEISGLRSNEESLMHRLSIQTSAGEETSRGFERAMAGNKALESKVKHLQNEKEQLKADLSELRSEEELLDRSMVDANNKCAAMQDQVNKFKSERNGLREKISEHEAAARNLKFELEKARAGLEDAAVKIARLRSENSRLAGDLDVLSSRNTEVEGRVRALLAERDELTTRINELNDESVGLQDQLNKAETENECFSTELNKSRAVNDKVEARNALLQVTCDKRESDNETLRRERDDARGRLDEIANECRMLENQLKIQRIKYETLQIAAATLHYENNDRKSYLKKIDARYPLVKDHERGFAAAHNNKARHKQNYSDAAQTSMKLEIGERKDDGTEFKAESDTRANHDNKARIKDKPKGELKRLRTENKALKLEPANLRSENSDITMKTAHMKDEFESPDAWTEGSNDEEIIGCTSKRIRVANICYEKEISNYSSHPNTNSTIFRDKVSPSVAAGIDQLELVNRALGMEVDILRGSLNLSLIDGEKTKLDFGRATEEIRALRFELMNLREEKATLRSRLEMFKEELNGLKSERVALKDELAATRKSNFDLRLKANDLRNANEKLKGTNMRLESRLQNEREREREREREINECATVSEASNRSSRSNIESVLKERPRHRER